jgi:hypothetical protein
VCAAVDFWRILFALIDAETCSAVRLCHDGRLRKMTDRVEHLVKLFANVAILKVVIR